MLTEDSWINLIFPVANSYPLKQSENNSRKTKSFQKLDLIFDTLQTIGERIKKEVPYFTDNIYTDCDVTLGYESFAYIKSGNLPTAKGGVESGFHVQFSISNSGYIKVEGYNHATDEEYDPFIVKYVNPEGFDEIATAKIFSEVWESLSYSSQLYIK